MKITNVLTGITNEERARQTPDARRRTTAYAAGVSLVLLLWATTGFLTARLMDVSMNVSVLIASVCALVVLFIERIVIASPGGLSVGCARLLLAVVMALLGSCVLDISLFARDIDLAMHEKAATATHSGYGAELAAQEKAITAANDAYLKAEADVACEVNQKCSGRAGCGTACKAKMAIAARLHAELERAKARYEALRTERQTAVDASHDARKPAGMLARIQALQEFTSTRPAAQMLWMLFFALVFVIELLVLGIKLAFGKTLSDEIESLRLKFLNEQARKGFAQG